MVAGGLNLSQAMAEAGPIDEHEFFELPRIAGHGAALSDRISPRRPGTGGNARFHVRFGSPAVRGQKICFSCFTVNNESAPNGMCTRVAAVKGRCPRPLDDGGLKLNQTTLVESISISEPRLAISRTLIEAKPSRSLRIIPKFYAKGSELIPNQI